MSDGGEGLLDVLGGPNRTAVVTGPLGAPVEAAWRMDASTAVIEMARASGLLLAGGAERQRPDAGHDGRHRRADRPGPRAGRPARDRRPRRLGDDRRRAGRGRGAAQSEPLALRRACSVACDVRTRFVDAAAVFAPQKGASPGPGRAAHRPARAARRALPRRVRRRRRPSSRAPARPAGSPAGWPRSGPTLVPGFELVADHIDLERPPRRRRPRRHRRGPPRRPEPRRQGGRRVSPSWASEAGKPVVVIVGDADDRRPVRRRRGGDRAVTSSSAIGLERAMAEPKGCIERAAGAALDRLARGAIGADRATSIGADRANVDQPPVVVVALRDTAGAETAVGRSSDSDLLAASVPSITSTVASPVAPSVGRSGRRASARRRRRRGRVASVRATAWAAASVGTK